MSDELIDELGPFSKLKLSQEKSSPPPKTAPTDMNTFTDLFLNLSVSMGEEISITLLEAVVSRMKANARDSISLPALLTELNVSQVKKDIKQSHLSSENKSSTSKVDADDIVFEDADDEESISSSLNSSWAESPSSSPPAFSFQPSPLNNRPAAAEKASLPSPPVNFDFKTPQKIFHAKNKNISLAEEEKKQEEKTDNAHETTSPGYVVDSSPPPNFFDRNVSASAAGSVFGPPDEALLPNKQNIKETTTTDPVARTLFSNKDNMSSSNPSGGQTEPLLTSSLFNGGTAPTVTFDMGKSSDKGTSRGQKAAKKNPKGRGGKSHLSQNLPTTNFQAFRPPLFSTSLPTYPPPPSTQPEQSTTTPNSSSQTNPPPPSFPEGLIFPSSSPMDMEQSPSDHDLKTKETCDSKKSFSFSMGSGSASSSSKLKSSTKGSHRKNRRAKTAPAGGGVGAADTNSSPSSTSTTSFHTSPIKNSSSYASTFPDTEETVPEDKPQTTDSDEVDGRMIALAELFKKEGKTLYNSERYDMAYDAFSKALKAAPEGWKDCANVLSNRAASLMMMERIVEAISDCEKSAELDSSFLKVHSRRGRALFKLGRIDDATMAFQHVLSAPVSEEEAFQNEQHAGADYAGRNLARAAMKQIILAKSLLTSLDRMHRIREQTLEGSDTNPATKVYMQTANELLALCPYMRKAQVHKSRALAQMHQWVELKEYIEMCVVSVHHTMQDVDAHPLARLPLHAEVSDQLQWWEDTDEAGTAAIDTSLVKNFFLVMGPSMAQCYVVALKNQNLSRTSCSSSIMRTLIDILSDLRVQIEGAHRMDELLDEETVNHSQGWEWLLAEVTKISNTLALKQVADEKFRLGKFAEAIKSYGAVLQVDTDAHIWNAIMFGNRAAASMRLRLFSDAVSDCHQSLARDPHYARAYLRRARAQRELGHFSASIRDYKKYLKTSPRPADSLDVQIELEEATNAKIEEELLAAAKKKREAAEARDREWRQKEAERKSEGFKERARRADTRARSKQPFEETQRENYSNQRRERQQQQHSFKSSSSSSYQRQRETAPPPPSQQPEIHSENFYIRLGVPTDADEKVIKTAYRKMALKYHPDKNKDNPSSTELFKKLTEAYSTLSDSSARRTYDETTLFEEVYGGRGARGSSRRYGW